MKDTQPVCQECGGPLPTRRSGGRRPRTCGPVCSFWSMIDKSAGPSGCWPWRSHISPTSGYGDVPARYADGKRSTAHRTAWKLANACDPGALCVLHRCDNRTCCNPAHLFLGTRKENTWDAWKKGRPIMTAPGQDHPKAVLTDEIVRHIRGSGENAVMLARRYGVRPSTIRSARRGETWRHLVDDADADDPTTSDRSPSRQADARCSAPAHP